MGLDTHVVKLVGNVYESVSGITVVDKAVGELVPVGERVDG
jgi:hypothetical protein